MLKIIIKKYLPAGACTDLRLALAAAGTFVSGLARTVVRRNTLATVRGKTLQLHLGCGARPQNGWINVDLYPPAGAYYADLRNPLALADESVRHIHCEHVLEHLEFDDALFFLGQCHRVLEPHGTLRLVLPDAEKYITAYCRGDQVYFKALEGLGNAARPLKLRIEVINQMFRMGGAHRFAWDFETLRHYLQQVGFRAVANSSFNDVRPEYRIDGVDEWRAHESLYINAEKG